MSKTARKSNGKSLSKLPSGFTKVERSFGAWHDFKKEPVLTGKCLEIHKSKGKYGPQRVMTVETKSGLRSVSESHALEGLFNSVKPGKQSVYIKYSGVIKLKGGKTMKDYVTAVG